MTETNKANLWLILVATIWGLTFPLVKNAINDIDPFSFVVIRFSLATLLFLPFVLKEFSRSNIVTLKAGLTLGVINSAAYTLQTVSLQYIGSSRCAFITGSFVVIVPLIAPLFGLGRLHTADIICALVCVVGLYILTGANLEHLNYGDMLVFFSAIGASIAIVYLQKIAGKVQNYKLLSFYQIVFVVPIPLLLLFIQPTMKIHFKMSVITAILFCSMMATVVTLFLQAKYQRHTTAAKAALIFMLEPILASIFGLLINGEPITSNIILGGIIMLSSIIGSELFHIIFTKR